MLHRIVSYHNGKGELVFEDTRIPIRIDSLSTSIDACPHFEGHVAGAIYGDMGGIRTNYAKCYTGTTDKFAIKNVIFNNPATIVFWADGTKTVVKCQEDDIYSEEVGLALCFAKKALGNKSNFNNVFKKWVPEEKEEPVVVGVDPFSISMRNIGENAKSSSNILDEVRKLLNRPITPEEV